MIQDGQYEVHRHLNGKDQKLGSFAVSSGNIKFASEADKLNIDQFPEGKMSKRTMDRIEYLMNNKDKDIYITKV